MEYKSIFYRGLMISEEERFPKYHSGLVFIEEYPT
jgi:hypothetical protein